MTVDKAIDEYMSISEKVFSKPSRIGWKGNIQGRFSSGSLEEAIKALLLRNNLDEDTLLKAQDDALCKV
jgi:hypothetical protein